MASAPSIRRGLFAPTSRAVLVTIVGGLIAVSSVGIAAADPFDGLTIEPETDAEYSRSMYPHWRDDDDDCQDARQEVLIAESLVPPVMDEDGCRVVSGLWFGLYAGRTFTDPGDLDIDHFVPLKEAHESGGHAWSTSTRRQYANDLSNPGHLVAVSANQNRSKGHRDPAEWLPADETFHCAYVLAWLGVKRAWSLSVDEAEKAAIEDVLGGCE